MERKTGPSVIPARDEPRVEGGHGADARIVLLPQAAYESFARAIALGATNDRVEVGAVVRIARARDVGDAEGDELGTSVGAEEAEDEDGAIAVVDKSIAEGLDDAHEGLKNDGLLSVRGGLAELVADVGEHEVEGGGGAVEAKAARLVRGADGREGDEDRVQLRALLGEVGAIRTRPLRRAREGAPTRRPAIVHHSWNSRHAVP